MSEQDPYQRPAGLPAPQGLYDPRHEHDACGVGFVANIDGRRDHNVVARATEVLSHLLHRGAVGGDQKTGDGAGILMQIPDAFFRTSCPDLGFELPEEGTYGVGMFFLPRDDAKRQFCEQLVEDVAAAESLRILGWRQVPVDPGVIAGQALEEMPDIRQCFLTSDGLSGAALERKLYVARKVMERGARKLEGERPMYIVSLSCRTITYKGLLMGGQVPAFYTDLQCEATISAIALIHQRYSTNTFPSWELAQPFRYLAHNGEINTLRGNQNHMRNREKELASELFGDDIKKLLPVLDETGSDSAQLDNALELLLAAGRSLPHAMMMLVAEAWGPKYFMSPDLRGFFEYHAGLMEPWDGPAALSFTDGKNVGCLLDRNGLRPVRYTITKGGFIVLASETGVLDFAPEDVLERGALRPGQMILVDTERGRVLNDHEIKHNCARSQPYRRWVEENRIDLHGFYGAVGAVEPDHETLLERQRRFGYTREDVDFTLRGMAETGHEPINSMGADVPLAIFSEKHQLLYNYFKQLFAQITNPAIDPIREELVMSLMTFIGNHGNILEEKPSTARLIKLRHPILSNEDLRRLRKQNVPEFQLVTFDIGFPAGGDGAAMKQALDDLCRRVERAVLADKRLIVLSDRQLTAEQAAIPALLAVSAVNQHLARKGLRTNSGLIVESGEPREVMHMALLLGFGATAINPYLAFETVADLASQEELGKTRDVAKAIESYIKGICKGLLKIMSKMGIATLRSYRSAQVFEAIGIKSEVMDAYFTGTASRIEGVGLDEIATEANARHAEAFVDVKPWAAELLPVGGRFKFRKDGERHLWTPESLHKLQHATRTGDTATYREYAALINEQAEKQFTLRGMMKFRKRKSIPLGEVEPAAEIMKRFVTGAMSFGSISREAHESLAIAMNRIGGKSNSGEGGEDPARYVPLPNGDSRSSAIKQVASGRFGVTIEYLVNCQELQIKIAQGAKPGEGGQLPGHKVNAEIAKVRHSTPGVTLISPPPHHDIYSIEDIAQLIFDLKNANPNARVSVKLVSEVGVGTIAAGVAKAKADMVLISGFDGGTGASPMSSIHHAGAPWELGLAETQQTLVMNNLRERIRVQTDGQLKTGRDVVIAALLGAEEYGFATTALVVNGCVMMRCCHLNTCPVGVATQDPELRKRFRGSPDYVVNFMNFIAEEVREYMAELGFRTIDEMVGRTDCLEVNDAVEFWKARGLDYSRLLDVEFPEDSPKRCIAKQEHDLDSALDMDLIKAAKPALDSGKPVVIERQIRNLNRTAGTMLSGRVAEKYGLKGLPEDTIRINFTGAAGQSFGAFAACGVTMTLHGEGNDYVGKGLSGGKIIIKPEAGTTFDPARNIAAGNVLLYGATGGELYVNGRVGERFAIRNSGARAVVEGIGDHGCEYMTGGRVVVLGPTGINFGAGMSGGIAYVYSQNSEFDNRCNLDMVDLELVVDDKDIAELRTLIENHLRYTGSPKAKCILDNWDDELPKFVKVFPMEYRRVLGLMTPEDEQTEREEVTHG
jgi:glutamate synthase domain-containing protein 2/glutamate synthase domain-containing protein 1/glutamate synthase domain-containing protein 3